MCDFAEECGCPGGGEGIMVSHIRGTRFAGSCDKRLCNKVDPVRGSPRMMMGALMLSSAISG